MKSLKYDLTILQGATFGLTVKLKQSNGLPFDLTGYTGKGQIRETPDDPVSICDIDITFSNPRKNGQIELKIPADKTKEFNFGWGVYDVKLTSSQDEVIRILQGKVLVDKEVTK